MTWDLTTAGNGCIASGPGADCGDGNGVPNGAAGNIRTFTSGTNILKAAAFSAANTTSNFSKGWLGMYTGSSFGLGVTNKVQPEDGTAPGHTVDNLNARDMVVFEFPTSGWTPLSTFLNSNGSWGGDTDISAWVGGNSIASLSDPIWTTLKYSTLTSNGFTEYTSPGASLTGSNGGRTANLNNDPTGPTPALNLTGKFLIIAGSIANLSDLDDKFKIKNLSGQTPANVPEPMTSALLGTGLLALGLLKRRMA